MLDLMRRVVAAIAIVSAVWVTPACGAVDRAQPAVAPDGRGLGERAWDPADYGAQSLLVVHYHRPDGDYEGWNLWAWPDGLDGGSYAFEEEDGFGRIALVPIEDKVARAGFLIRLREWEAKDVDRDRFVTFDKDGLAEVWVVAGNPEMSVRAGEVDLTMRVTGAFLDARDVITLTTTARIDESDADAIEVREIRGGRVFDVDDVSVERDPYGDPLASGVAHEITLAEYVPAESIAGLEIVIPGEDPVVVYARGVLEDAEFEALDAELGNRYTPDSTAFSVWSPVASRVDVLLFDEPGAAQPTRVIEMERGEGGVWSTRVEGDLHSVEYQYVLRSYGEQRTVPDVHAYAANEESTRSVVIDLDKTDPEGWGSVPNPPRERQVDEVIYEIHVRDYSIADPSCPPELRGTYLGIAQAGEAGDATGGISTGVAHLKELGVTAVHLLPIHDYPGPRDGYNWGYWTSLFNVPESNYATEGAGPDGTIRELKAMIQELHRNGIRVILDVVYNHTSSSFEASAFDQTVPWYFFRTTSDGRLSNDAGVGNSVADERAMVRKYILDSLRFWMEEYRVDGFRFDLMGTHEPETVRAVCEELLAERPDLTLYGEPWTGGGPIRFGKGAQRGLRIAVFNDNIRNAIRGDLDGEATGFATGPGGDADAIRRGVAAGLDEFADDPNEVITYASAHDNLTLWDKIEKVAGDEDEATKRSMQKLALGIVLTSQGTAFLHGGSDFCRTKGGNHNSYNAGDGVNKLDWERKAEFRDVFDYVAGLVAVRRAHPAFRLGSADEIVQHLDFRPTRDGVVSYTIDGAAAGDGWARVFVAYNGEPRARTVTLPEGAWAIVVDADRAGEETLREVAGEITLPGYSMVVAKQD